MKKSQTPGLLRGKKNFAMEIATEPLVMASEIAGLEPLRGYIKQENRVLPVKFALTPLKKLQPGVYRPEDDHPRASASATAATGTAAFKGCGITAEASSRKKAGTDTGCVSRASVSRCPGSSQEANPI